MCGDRECNFNGSLLSPKHPQNFIFTPKIGIKQSELIHVFLAGVKAINISLVKGTREEHQELIQTIDWAIKIFLLESKFNFRITKVCTIRGRVPRTGRMRNKSKWKLCNCHEIVLTTDSRYENCSSGDICYISNFQRFISKLHVKDLVKINSEIVVQIAKITQECYVTCQVVEGGCLGSYQEVKVQVIDECVFTPTDEEFEDCGFVRQHDIDFVVIPSVRCSEQAHKIKDLINGAKMIAQIDSSVEKETIDRIIEHSYGVFVGESWFSSADEYIINKGRDTKKLVVSGGGSKSCEVADALLLKPVRCGSCIYKLNDELTTIMKKERTSIDTDKSLRDLKTSIDEAVNCVAPTLEKSMEPNTKAIVSLTQTRKTVETIAHARPPCPIILMTECPLIAKRLQLWRNVNGMVYVDCENKEWNDKRLEMMQIAGLFGNEMKILEADEILVTCCYTRNEQTSEIGDCEIVQ